MYCRLAAGDGLAVVIGFSLGRLVRTDDWMTPHGVNLMVVIAVLYAAMGVITRAFALEVLDDYVESARRALIALVQAFMILFALLFAFQLGQEISRVALFMALGATLSPMLAFRYAAYVWIRRTLRSRLFDELLIVDGFDAPATPGAVRIDAALNGLSPDLDNPAMLERIALVTLFYDRVVVACTAERQNAWAVMLKSIGTTGEILLDDTNEMGAIGVGQFGGARTMIVSRGSLSMSDRAKKRMFDLAVAIPALVFLAPLLIIVAILIRLDSPGPALFRQPRVGRNNVAFSIYKFRSMRVDQADQAGARSTARDDERVSRFGRFIRRTSIDELPQLFNVIKGDMSIVGPRPHALGSTAGEKLFWQISHHYWERHALKPGITGLAQVRGFRGATEQADDLVNRLQADLEYLQDWRLWRDIAIILATLRVLVHPNAY